MAGGRPHPPSSGREDLPRCSDPVLPDAGAGLWPETAPDDGVRSEPAGAAGQVRLRDTGLYDALPSAVVPGLPVELSERWQRGDKLDLAIDSTGLKVFGEGDGAARAVEGAQAWGGQASDLAQAARGHRRQHPADRLRVVDG